MTRLFVVEVRRALARGITRALVVIALAMIAVMGVWVFVAVNDGEGLAAQKRQQLADIERCQDANLLEKDDDGLGDYCRYEVNLDPDADLRFRYTDLLPPDGREPTLLIPALFLLIGGLLGGASMIGAEWQAGSLAVLLTWETRRTRVLLVKVAAAALLASIIAFGLLVLFSAALYPTAALKGTTEGVDAAWLGDVLGAIARMSLVTGLAAAVGFALGMIGRRTSLALVVAFVYVAIVEPVLRGMLPSRREWFVGENMTAAMVGRDLDDQLLARSPLVAALTLAIYAAVLVFFAAVSFRRREIGSA